ncbi:cytosolic Fe S cluster assembly factor nubp1 [Echinococcus multilocularis]|uniref:Cytosolic Fe S cluster assembly factor nubp1 n=1 Tax=Echinococcus multilocularis TaxID=6211 RepID=A0A087VX72_ECHMU|nr:cytosolic Fe S cluster assembly factor nubp1 [Echinococcus multilocularis]
MPSVVCYQCTVLIGAKVRNCVYLLMNADGVFLPENTPVSCPGPQSESAGRDALCAGCPNQALCASGAAKLSLEEREPEVVAELRKRLGRVRHCLFVLSGKGGVGKSSVSACLAWAFARQNCCRDQVGLLDLDICGPSIPCLMGCLDSEVHQSASGWSPVFVADNLALMSVGFLISPNQALVWRGPQKNSFIRDILCKVSWTDAYSDETAPPLDYLLIDTPPGTSDEHLSSVPYIKAAGCPVAALIITTPQEVALSDVRKEINFCEKIGLQVVGIVENMSAVECPKCGFSTELFPRTTGGADSLIGMEVIGRIPFDSRLTRCLDEGRCPFEETDELAVTESFDSLTTIIKMKLNQIRV